MFPRLSAPPPTQTNGVSNISIDSGSGETPRPDLMAFRETWLAELQDNATQIASESAYFDRLRKLLTDDSEKHLHADGSVSEVALRTFEDINQETGWGREKAWHRCKQLHKCISCGNMASPNTSFATLMIPRKQTTLVVCFPCAQGSPCRTRSGPRFWDQLMAAKIFPTSEADYDMGNEKRRRTEAETQASDYTKMPSNRMDPRVMDMLVRTTRHPTMVAPICSEIMHRHGWDTLTQGTILCHGPPLCPITGCPEDRLITLHRRAASTWQNHEHNTRVADWNQQQTGDNGVRRDSQLVSSCLKKTHVLMFCKSLAHAWCNTGERCGEMVDLFVKTFNNWADEFLLLTEDPNYRQPLLSIAIIDGDLCSRIHKQLDEFWICRNKECRWVGIRQQRIKNKNYSKFACPMCGRKNCIWRQHANLDGSNMVWINHPDSFCRVQPEQILIERSQDYDRIISDTRPFMNVRLVMQPPHEYIVRARIVEETTADLSMLDPCTLAREVNLFEQSPHRQHFRQHTNERAWVDPGAWSPELLPDTLFGFKYLRHPDDEVVEYRQLVRTLVLSNGLGNILTHRSYTRESSAATSRTSTDSTSAQVDQQGHLRGGRTSPPSRDASVLGRGENCPGHPTTRGYCSDTRPSTSSPTAGCGNHHRPASTHYVPVDTTEDTHGHSVTPLTTEAEDTSKEVHGMTISVAHYLCRNTECHWVGSRQRVNEETIYHILCPRCGQMASYTGPATVRL